MRGRLHLQLQNHGHEARGFPVHVQIIDSDLRTVRETWGRAGEEVKLDELEPGPYGVRVSLASTRHLDSFAMVEPDGDTRIAVPLHELSPHEGHEWAYFSQRLEAPTTRSLIDAAYEGTWLRLWEFADRNWRPVPIPSEAVARPDVSSDGVTYRFRSLCKRPHALQTGGSRIPWRCTALPPVEQPMVLIKPAGPDADYPLDVVVSTENWSLQTLLSFLQSGQATAAEKWAEGDARIAEDFLYSKRRDPAAAAVGGYFLLKTRRYDLLHDWTNNLANWIEWMPDGPIIHAWHLFAEAQRESDHRVALTARARERLLEATDRGIPLYTEGLRLLRNGLLGLHRAAKGRDEEVEAALDRAGEYMSLCDLSMPTTSYLAEVPDRPLDEAPTGLPEDGHPMMYVFDVPLRDLITAGLLAPGEELAVGSAGEVPLRLREDGGLRAADGTSYRTLTDLSDEVSTIDELSPYIAKVLPNESSLFEVGEPLRRQTFSRTPAGADQGVVDFGFSFGVDEGHFEEET